MKKNNYFPLFISMEKKKILVVGAGQIAFRRISILMQFGAKITVAAPEVYEKIEALEGVFVLKEKFKEEMLAGKDFVIAATDNLEVNRIIVKLCRELKIPVNNASSMEECDFFFPAVVEYNGLICGVSSGGADHKKVSRFCKWLREILKENPMK